MNPSTHLTAADALKKLLAGSGPTKLRIYPEGRKGRLWFSVWVYDTPRQLHLHRLLVARKIGQTPEGGVYAFMVQAKPDRRGNIGDVVFSHWSCTDNCVAHELLHAAIWYAHMKRFPLDRMFIWNDYYHERLAEALGTMMSSFWRLYTNKFPRKECWGYGRKP